MPVRKRIRKSRPLVIGYLERVSSRVFSDYSKQLTDLVGRQHGVYSLYKGSKLYYVGLATNLRGRIRQHLKDKHAGKWDKFSLYLVRKADHIKELESIIMRIANPAGNTARGRLPRADNLKQALDLAVLEKQRRDREDLFGIVKGGKRKKGARKGPRANVRKATKAISGSPGIVLPGTSRRVLRGLYKGKTYRAKLHPSGLIEYAGKRYKSPSGAGRAAKGRTTNGWKFWHVRNSKGEWVPLQTIRKR